MTTRTPATPEETLAVKCLQRCRLPAASWDKRFLRQVPEMELSEKERPQVWRLFYKYRRQIQPMMIVSHKRDERTAQIARFQTLLHHAAMHAAPDLRKQQQAANEQARIDQMKLLAAKTEDLTAENAESTKIL
jgi:hypothetical protein